jgi:hypothetical protein
MTWLVSAKQYTPAVIGEPFGGGYFAGYISHTADGNPTHALIVAPQADGATGTGYTLTADLQWKTTDTTTTGTTSSFDGAANTAAMVTAGIANHPAAEFCVNLNIGGFTDWYLPARFELDIAYFNLKPSTTSNSIVWGINDYSVPKRTANYTLAYPQQTYVTAFSTSTEAFLSALHWSSTEGSSTGAWNDNFATGAQSSNLKTNFRRVRAFRRIAL